MGLPEKTPAPPNVRLPGKPVLVAVFALYAAVLLRTLANPNVQARLPAYLVLELVFLALFCWMLWRPAGNFLWLYFYVLIQASIILSLLALRPKFDFIIILFIMLSFQAVLLFTGTARWTWVGLLVLLMGGSLMIGLGPMQGLALALLPMTIAIVFPAYVSITLDIENRLSVNQVMLTELTETNRQLQLSIDQTEELSAIEERIRLARELHDSVSQTLFGITLQTRAAQLYLRSNPEHLGVHLEHLQVITQEALGEMRSLLAQLRPPEDASNVRRTP